MEEGATGMRRGSAKANRKAKGEGRSEQDRMTASPQLEKATTHTFIHSPPQLTNPTGTSFRHSLPAYTQRHIATRTEHRIQLSCLRTYFPSLSLSLSLSFSHSYYLSCWPVTSSIFCLSSLALLSSHHLQLSPPLRSLYSYPLPSESLHFITQAQPSSSFQNGNANPLVNLGAFRA